MTTKCTLSTGELPPGGLPRNSVVRKIDHAVMPSPVYRGRKATTNQRINGPVNAQLTSGPGISTKSNFD